MPIRDQHKYRRLESELKGIKSLRILRPFLSLFGEKGREAAKVITEALDKVPEFESELEILRSTPDKFNELFRDHGWIAYDDMKHDAMLKAVSIAETDGLESAESFLVQFYNEGEIERWLNIFCFHPFMHSRKDLLQLALLDHRAGRYHASVPVVLAQIDGITQDLSNATFYKKSRAKAKHLTATETIVGDPDGLAALSEIISMDRRSTSTSPIDIPYRHGILHGRDLGYANLVVSTKSFALLLALRTWVLKVINDEQFTEPPVDYIDYDKVTWEDAMKAFSEMKEALLEYKRVQSSGDQ